MSSVVYLRSAVKVMTPQTSFPCVRRFVILLLLSVALPFDTSARSGDGARRPVHGELPGIGHATHAGTVRIGPPKYAAIDVQPYRFEDYQRWQLKQEDWTYYLSLMEGPRGRWTPGLDPLVVLGIHARSRGERMRFARAFVAMESERINEELAFQRAVNRVVEQERRGAPFAGGAQNERLLLFATLACEAACTKLIAKAQERMSRHDGTFSVYLSGAEDDEAIRYWALARNIDKGAVFSGRIELHHDRGEWRSAREHHPQWARARLPQLLARDEHGAYQSL